MKFIRGLKGLHGILNVLKVELFILAGIEPWYYFY